MSDALDSDGVIKQLAAEFPSEIGVEFVSWFTRSDDTIDGESKQKAYASFDSSFIDAIGVRTAKGWNRFTHIYLAVYMILQGRFELSIYQKQDLFLPPPCF